MRISDWSSDVCSSDLSSVRRHRRRHPVGGGARQRRGPPEGRACGPARPAVGLSPDPPVVPLPPAVALCRHADRKSGVEGKSVSVRGDFGGWRILKKKNKRTNDKGEDIKQLT